MNIRRSMWRTCLRWASSHRKTVAGLILAAALIALNAVAFMHAWAMTHFVQGGTRTASPEALSRLQKVKLLVTGVKVPKPVNEHSPASLGLAFETHRLAGDDRDELEAWYVPREPSRGLVVMFHGYASCKSEILREAAAFHELGFAALLVDFRGSGGSSGSTTSVGVFEADDVERVWEYVAERWPREPRIMFGQSMGGAAVLRAVAVHELRPDALIVECPFDRLSSTVGNRFTAMGLPSFPLAQLLVFWGGVQQGFNGFGHNPAEYANLVTVPTLMLHGDQDPRVTLNQAQSIFDNLAGAREFEVFHGAGHESYVARDAKHWNRVVRQFLDRQEQP